MDPAARSGMGTIEVRVLPTQRARVGDRGATHSTLPAGSATAEGGPDRYGSIGPGTEISSNWSDWAGNLADPM